MPNYEEIPNPLDAGNLTGIYHILVERFNKRSFVTFTNTLIRTMSWYLSEEDTRKSPIKGVREVEKLMNEWDKKSLWDQMHKDIFFTSILLKGLHAEVPFRRELLTQVNRFIKDLESRGEDMSNADGSFSHGKTPIFRYAVGLIDDEQNNRKLASTYSKPDSRNKGNENNYSGGRYHRSGPQSTLEHANVASEVFLSASVEKDRTFSGEVPKSQAVSVQDTHNPTRKHSYIAMKSQEAICRKCYAKEEKDRKVCKPRPCFAAYCKRCKFYGHKTTNCLHAVAVDGNPIN